MKYSQDSLKIISGKKVAVLGIGVEGITAGSFLQSHKADVVLFDERRREEIEPGFLQRAEELGITCVLNKPFGGLSDFHVIVRSPGVKKTHPAIVEAVEKGAILTSQTKLFFDFCPCPIIGVTGTKGKGTTSTLIYKMLKESGKDVFLGGNIGTAPLGFLDHLHPQSLVVLELSSFQLQDLHKSPHIAVMLMVVPEHLNYHEDMEEYVDAKRNILRYQTQDDFAILNRDYIPSHESDIFTEASVFYISRERGVVDGCFVKEDVLWMRKDGKEKKIIDLKDIALLGKHNVENVSAAVIAADLAGADKDAVVRVLTTFTGLEHRLQLVREVNGVKYYDDSFSTTPETTIAAIDAFTAPEVLILGGSSKNSDFKELSSVIKEAKNIKAIIGIGDEWYRIRESLHGLPEHVLLIEGADSMQKVVRAAAAVAKNGDVVLLSPACASFGMFKNYKERGNLFQEEVKKLS